MTDFKRLLQVLVQSGADFVVVGGVASVAHGSVQLTVDIDLVYSRSPGSVDRLVAALHPFDPYPRDVPGGLPFKWDARTVMRGLNFTLTTSIGEVDLFGEIPGGGSYEDMAPSSVELEVFGERCRFVDLETLIRTKQAAGRAKDLQALAELEALREERDR